MVTFGTGIAMAGVSLAAIGLEGLFKNQVRSGAVATAIGFAGARIGYEVAMGNIERMRGLR